MKVTETASYHTDCGADHYQLKLTEPEQASDHDLSLLVHRNAKSRRAASHHVFLHSYIYFCDPPGDLPPARLPA